MKPRTSTGEIRARRNVHRFLRMTVGLWLRVRFNITTENLKLVKNLRPPYLLLPNHVGYWDPFQLSTFIPHPVHHVAADQNFRTRPVRTVMRLVGAIPKTKGVSDSELVRWILKLRDRRRVISLFPEGQRTWDGASLPVLYSTAKLVKLLRVPVVVPVFKGGYFSHPRWAFKPRRGKLVIEFRHAFSGDELRSLSADDIHARLTALIGNDAYEHQATHMIRFRGRRPAEDIEHVLFICPSCRSFATLHSRRRHVTCSACGYRLVYTDYGYLVPASDRAQHLTIRDLNRSQLEYFAGYLDGVSAETPVFSEPDTVLSTGYRTNPVHRVATGTLTLYADRIVFARGGPGGVLGDGPGLGGGGRGSVGGGPGELVFPLADIEGLNVQLTRKLELYHRGRLYTFDPTDRKCSMYKWQVAIEHLTTRQMSDAGFAG